MHRRIKAALLASLLGVVISPAYAEEMNRMALTGSGHGILFSGEAREQAGVPKEIADYIWGMQEQLTTYHSDLHKIPELGHKEVDTHAYLMKTLKERRPMPRTRTSIYGSSRRVAKSPSSKVW